MRIEPKLRTSIVEGISVFLSLFDDNPRGEAHVLPAEGHRTIPRRIRTASTACRCRRSRT